MSYSSSPPYFSLHSQEELMLQECHSRRGTFPLKEYQFGGNWHSRTLDPAITSVNSGVPNKGRGCEGTRVCVWQRCIAVMVGGTVG
ncbi:hypothetical protein HaLaN_07498, partial [Haematococcus lacustris]